VDAAGRIYVSTGAAVDVFSAAGDYLGTIPGPDGLHGVAFSGPDKRTLYAIIYSAAGPDGPVSQVVSIPTLTQGYPGRAK
jgi:sugar lactone lactonase YvrE